MMRDNAAWWADPGSTRRLRELARACALLDVLRARARGSNFARRWFLASILRGHQRMDWDATNWVATAGLSRFPDDPDLLLAHGTVLEAGGWRSAPDLETGRPFLERAESAFARAEVRAAGSALEEAELRLAHVRWRLGKTSSARAGLERLLARTGDPRRRYLGFLFLGGVLEEEGTVSEAGEVYRRSIEARPDTQAGGIALAHGLARLGDIGAARVAVDQALAHARTRAADPFWTYPWGRSGESSEVLAALRAEATRCCR